MRFFCWERVGLENGGVGREGGGGWLRLVDFSLSLACCEITGPFF